MSGENSAFFYGTLMAPEVFYTVCYPPELDRKVLSTLNTFKPAVLHGYCRHRVAFADYPGVIKEEGQSVLGVYVDGLTDANVKRLDDFEGPEYIRQQVEVSLVTFEGEGDEKKQVEGEKKLAYVYIFIHPDALEKGEWDFEHFRKEKMAMWTRADYVFSDFEGPAAVAGPDGGDKHIENAKGAAV